MRSLLFVFTFFIQNALFCQDTSTFKVANFEEFEVYFGETEIEIMSGSLTHLDSFGKVENKTCNYSPMMIQAHKLVSSRNAEYAKDLEANFVKNFTDIACLEQDKTIDRGDGVRIIVLKANKNGSIRNRVGNSSFNGTVPASVKTCLETHFG
jgi:hypothetical protein